MADLLLKNGTVVFENEVRPADILIRDEHIAGIFSPGDAPEGIEVLDITGLHVMPGAIDPHMHLGLYNEMGESYRLDSQRQIIGGMTTLIDYHRGKGNYFETVAAEISQGEANSYADFAISLGLCAKRHVDELEDYVSKLGITSFKFFNDKKDIAHQFYGISPEEALKLDKPDLYRIFKRLAEIDSRLLLCVHCEDPDLFRALSKEQQELHPDATDLATYNVARPGWVEAQSVADDMQIAHETGGNLYVVHTSAKESLAFYRALSAVLPNGQYTLETCPQYLALNEDSKCGLDGKVNPPFRKAEDNEALWEGIREGIVKTIGTDNCPTVRAKKYEKGPTLWDNFVGFSTPGIAMPLLISEGYHRRQIPLCRISQVLSVNAARIFNLPNKGEIKVGYDADLAIVDLNWEREITPDLFGMSDFSIFEGFKFKGWPRYTLLRGKIIQENGVITAKQGTGKYLFRKL